MTNSVAVDRVVDFDDPSWNEFVIGHDHGTCFHLLEWAKIAAVVGGWEPYYLIAQVQGKVCGVLPLVHVKNRFTREALVSTPFCVYGGVVANDEHTRTVLENAASELARKLRVTHLEVRQRRHSNVDWRTSDLYFSFRKTLLENEEENMAAIPRKQRAMVRKGIKAGLTAEFGHDVETFYELFSIGMRNLGTPVYPQRLFDALVEVFGDMVEIVIVRHQNKPIAGVLSFSFRDEVLPYYSGSISEARAIAGFDFMYWELMRSAVAKGFRQFDFGRSMRDSGAFAFKKNWGFEPQPLNYQYDLISGGRLPVKDPDQFVYKSLTSIWRRLPLNLANKLGPIVSLQLY